MSASTSPTAVFTRSDYRFERMLVLAFALHMAIIFAIGFEARKQSPTSQILDVRLMKGVNETLPENPEFIAENNRLGSGEDEESLAKDQPLEAKKIQQRYNTPKEQKKPSNQIKKAEIINTKSASKDKTSVEENAEVSPDLLSQSLKQVALQARSEYLEETFKKNPRIKRIRSVSAKGASYAHYLKHWQRAMERYGTKRYPAEAKGCTKDTCNLRLLVSINTDGTLRELKILQSSGRIELDDFALETVERIMPFSPFSNKMKAELDVLEIVRRFEFIDEKGFRMKRR